MSGPHPDPSLVDRFEDGSGYDQFMGRWSRAAGAVFLRWLKPPSNADWLDVGCGTGAFTDLIVTTCSPRSVIAIDPSAARIEHARRERAAALAEFRLGYAEALTLKPARFDIVSCALALNFMGSPVLALSEMRRVTRPGGRVAAYVWDFEAELSPTWPLRKALAAFGIESEAPGAEWSGLPALKSAFERAGLRHVSGRMIQAAVCFADFDDFWTAQTRFHGPLTAPIHHMAIADRTRVKNMVRSLLSARGQGQLAYAARANAVKARVPEA